MSMEETVEMMDTVGETAEETTQQEEIPVEGVEQVGEETHPDRQGELDEFLERYPNVSPDTIPKQVWQRFLQGESLSLAYALHENALLQSRLEQLQRLEDNRRRTPGSLGNQGREPDEFDKLWAED